MSETEKPYSNREIDAMQRTIHEKLDEILVQVKKTNGRVGRLENWRAYTTGAIAVILLVVIPILGWALAKVVQA